MSRDLKDKERLRWKERQVFPRQGYQSADIQGTARNPLCLGCRGQGVNMEQGTEAGHDLAQERHTVNGSFP